MKSSPKIRPSSVPTNELPSDLLLPVIKKMKTKTIFRFRQTCSAMNLYVEGNRHRIQSRSDTVPRNLCIVLEPFRGPAFYVLNKNVMYNYNPSYELEHTDRSAVKLIDDPVSQLSAAHFDAVIVEPLLYFENEEDVAICLQRLVPILKDIRLSTDWLCLLKVEDQFRDLFLKQVKFSKFHYWRDNIQTEDIKKWPLQQCSEVRLVSLSCPTVPLSECIGLAENAYFHVQDESEAKQWFSQFLKEIRNNSKAKKNLRLLKLRTSFSTDWGVSIGETPGLTLLGSLYPLSDGNIFPYPVGHEFFYKMPIGGEFAYIWSRGRFTEIIFEPIDDPETVFTWMCNCIFEKHFVVDISDAYEAYRSARNPVEAFGYFCSLRDKYMKAFYDDPSIDFLF